MNRADVVRGKAAPPQKESPKTPIFEPSWVIDDPVHRIFLICNLCDARIERFNPDGSPSYAGGDRYVRVKGSMDRREHIAIVSCNCPVGELKGGVHAPENYPSNTAIHQWQMSGEDPWKFEDDRMIRPITPKELDAWRQTIPSHATPKEPLLPF